jgi:hypothetical protein
MLIITNATPLGHVTYLHITKLILPVHRHNYSKYVSYNIMEQLSNKIAGSRNAHTNDKNTTGLA